MDKIYKLPYGYNLEYTIQNQPELLDIGQIGPLFNNDEYNINMESPASPSVIANELKRSMDMHFYPVSNSSYSHSNSTETSPGIHTSNGSPYLADSCSSMHHSYAHELNSLSGSNRFKRGSSSSPDLKKKIQYTSSSNDAMGCEEDEPLDTDEFYVGVKEEKLFNDSFSNFNSSNGINFNANDEKCPKNIDLVQNSILNATNKNNSFRGKSLKSISFSYWNWDNWVYIFNEKYEKIESPLFRVEADKGFFYSQFDEAFICQKKNHFQITTHTLLKNIPIYCKPKMDSEYYRVEKFLLQMYGIKQESPMQKIQIKQSDSDRKPVDYEPVECKFIPEQSNKLTKMRLHFAHTTNNNNRKRNKAGLTIPNPDQRYFLLVVEIQVLTSSGKIFTLCSSASERVIVRAVNPGQFKQEICDEKPLQAKINNILFKQSNECKNNDANTIFEQKHSFYGNVGINTANPDEALTVLGNIKLSGNVLQPSDIRIKENIEPVDTNRALENVSRLKIYKYDFKKEFTDLNGGQSSDYGVLAQHVQEIIPDAVVPTGNLVLSNGQIINNFLNVNKNRIHMECVGAVIALDDKTKNLNKKIEKIEQIISEKSMQNTNEYANFSKKNKTDLTLAYDGQIEKEKEISAYECCLNKKFFKFIIAFSVMIIAIGIIGILVLQILHHNRVHNVMGNNTQLEDGSSGYNESFFYPKLMPPPIVSPDCNKTACKFCCFDPKRSKSLNDVVNTSENLFATGKAVYLSDSRLFPNSTGANRDAKTALNNAILSVILFSEKPVIYVNLTLSSACTIPYCEEINGVNYYFVPIHSNVDTNIQFNLAFFLRQGFILRNCNVQKNGQLCPNTKFDPNNLHENEQSLNSTLNIYKDIFNFSKKYVFYAPITYFLHIDFVFRIFMESTGSSVDICSLPSYTLNSKNVLFKEYVFRFYRLC